MNDVDQQSLQHFAAWQWAAPTGFDIGRECCNVAGLFTGLIGRIFLCASIAEHVAERCRKVQSALLAMQNGRQLPTGHLILKADQLFRLILEEFLDIWGLKGWNHMIWQQGLIFHVKRLIKIDVALVCWVPEMIMGGRDDFVESCRTACMPVNLQQSSEVSWRYRVIQRVLGNVRGCHAFNHSHLNS